MATSDQAFWEAILALLILVLLLLFSVYGWGKGSAQGVRQDQQARIPRAEAPETATGNPVVQPTAGMNPVSSDGVDQTRSGTGPAERLALETPDGTPFNLDFRNDGPPVNVTITEHPIDGSHGGGGFGGRGGPGYGGGGGGGGAQPSGFAPGQGFHGGRVYGPPPSDGGYHVQPSGGSNTGGGGGQQRVPGPTNLDFTIAQPEQQYVNPFKLKVLEHGLTESVSPNLPGNKF